MDGVSAENGPPGVGVKLVALFVDGMALMLTPSPEADMMMSSSSSSERVSAETKAYILTKSDKRYNVGQISVLEYK